MELAGRDGLVLAPNAAQPVRPLPEEEELLLVGLAEVAGGCMGKGYCHYWSAILTNNKQLTDYLDFLFISFISLKI